MAVIGITEDNFEDYRDRLGYFADDIGREYTYAAATDDGTVMVWQLFDKDEEAPTRGEIKHLYTRSADSLQEILLYYKDMAEKSLVSESVFELPYDFFSSYSSVFEEAGFKVTDGEGRTIVVKASDVWQLPFVKRGKTPDYISTVSKLMLRAYRKGITNCIFHGAKGLCPDLATLPISYFNTELSCYVETDGKPNGFYLVHMLGDGSLMVDLLFAFGPDYTIQIAQMVQLSIRRSMDLMPPDTLIRICRHNKAAAALSSKFFPGVKGERMLFGKM